MRNLKRALSLALASVMLLGMMVVGAGAASYTDVSSEDNVEAIEVLNAVKVMIGKKGNFDPDAPVNRHEMAVIMAKLVLGTEAADNYVGTHPFTDVYPWADKYVAACYNEGIISGTSATTYGGTQPLTAVQAAAMMLRALGYEDLSKGATDWRAPVVAKANQIRLFKDVVSGTNAQLTRNQVAQLTLNTLKATMVDTEGQGGTVTTPDGTVVNLGNPRYVDRDVDESTAGTNYAGDNPSDAGYGKLQLLEELYDGKLKLLTTGEEDDLGRPAKTWEYDGDPVITIADDAKYTVVVNEKKTTMSLTEWAKEANKKLTIDGGATINANNCTVASSAATTLKIGDVVEFYDVSDNAASTVVVTRYSVGKIDEIKDCNPNVKKDKDAMEDDGAKYVVKVQKTLGSATKTSYYDTDIAGFGSNYAEGEYIAYVPGTGANSGKIIDSYIPETTDGKVTALDSKNSVITVGKTEYTIADTALTTLGSEYTLVLDKTGYVIGAEEIEAADVDLSEVLFIVKEYETKETKYGDTLTTQWVQTVSMDGVAKDYALYTFDPDKGSENANASPASQDDIKDGTFIADAKIAAGCFITVEENDDTKDLWDASEASTKISDDYTVESGAVVTGSTSAIEKDDTKLPGSSIRVDSSTKYVIAEKEAASLKVYQATGGIEHTLVSADNMYAITENVKGTKVALYVVLDTDTYNDESTSKDVVYVDADADYKAIQVDGKSGYYEFDVYGPDGDTMTVIAERDPATIAASLKFATYTTKEKGGETIYTFKHESGDGLDAALSLGAAYDNDNGTAGTGKGFVADKTFKGYYGTELSMVDASNYLDGIETKDAAFVDLHDTNDYGSSILSLEDMYNAKDEGYDVTLSVYLNKGAKLIVVTGVEETVPPHTHSNWSAWSEADGKHVRTCQEAECTVKEEHDPAEGSWVTSDASQHWHACSKCDLPADSKESHQTAAEVKASGRSVADDAGGSGTATTHSWTCKCGKAMSEACTGSSGSACPACGHNTD